jgi:hypothetical protein
MGTRKGGKMPSRNKKDLLIYQLKVTLKGIKPPMKMKEKSNSAKQLQA